MPLYEDADPDAQRVNTPEEQKQKIANATVQLARSLVHLSKVVKGKSDEILAEYEDVIGFSGRFVVKTVLENIAAQLENTNTESEGYKAFTGFVRLNFSQFVDDFVTAASAVIGVDEKDELKLIETALKKRAESIINLKI